jgi:predicted nucleic acid-binding protein
LQHFIHTHHLKNHTSSNKNQILAEIERIQLEKREKGLEREWGDSFFEDMVEEKIKRERENQNDIEIVEDNPIPVA